MAEVEANSRQTEETTPLRQCAVTRISRPVEDLIRFVLDPSGSVVPDLKRRLPGRGVWVTAARDCVEEAVKRNVFAKAFRASVQVSPELPGMIEGLLERAVVQSLSLANKAGLVVAGFAKVESALGRKDTVALLHAAEAGEDGRRKLDARFEACSREAGSAGQILNCLTSEQLSLALGRSNVIHAALRDGGAAGKFLSAAAQLERYWAGRQAYEAA